MTESSEIISIGTKPVNGTFHVKVNIYDDKGNVAGTLEAEGKKLTRLIEIIEPAKPVNL